MITKEDYKIGDLVVFNDIYRDKPTRGRIVRIETEPIDFDETTIQYIVEELMPHCWMLKAHQLTPSAHVPMTPYEITNVEISQMIINDAKKRNK